MPCQSASNTRCGFSSRATPDSDLHGRSFRNGVRFSVHTCSDGSVPWRSWCAEVDASRSPSGWNVSVGDVVRCSSKDPSDAQNRPPRALRRVFQRSSTLERVSDVQSVHERRPRTIYAPRLPSMPTARHQHQLPLLQGTSSYRSSISPRSESGEAR